MTLCRQTVERGSIILAIRRRTALCLYCAVDSVIPDASGWPLDAAPKIGEQKEDFPITPQVVEQIAHDIFSIPWGHHRFLIDRFQNYPQKALFFARQTVENGWSRSSLLNALSSDLYERQGKALTNFERTLPAETSDLAQELTKDPYNFAFTGITGRYNEKLLKDSLLNNITRFLVELGTGFAYVGREYGIMVGEREKFMDLLFYNLNLSCYVVVGCSSLLLL